MKNIITIIVTVLTMMISFNTYSQYNNTNRAYSTLDNNDYVYVILPIKKHFNNKYNIQSKDIVKTNERSVRELTSTKLNELIKLSKSTQVTFGSSFLLRKDAVDNMRGLVNVQPYAVFRFKKEDLLKFDNLYLGSYKQSPTVIYPNTSTKSMFYYYKATGVRAR